MYIPKITLDRTSGIPLHRQISLPIEEAIVGGELEPGTLIENEIDLARRVGVSRPTARRAMQTLVDHGLLLRKRGTGSVVAPRAAHRLAQMPSLNTDLRAAGEQPTTEVVTYNYKLATTAIAEKLGVDVGAQVVELERLRLRNGTPMAILYNWLPVAIAPSREELEERGLYELLAERGITVASTHQTVSAMRPDRREARLLAISTRQPVLTIERTAYDSAGQIVEWGLHTHRGDLYQYTSTVFAATE
ncbi:DNA-binding GntR family transcriptional regulator [Arcanobacterium wilhelmae]|uniref:DNA-binding GntR family transcriptional regulator n=1 Tax=Arcanobacterium wilhelmae TaxID=1803177 RepID=A0ABT9NCX8_9ACTO|nr:GntR family transcriptional regulator [Arcanobacterium wilhelmae]MDP9801051.1 DNA-binding GntR family transcriptional regulator [Arcanobacterium wilhelmae]WFN90408.1 GntR family transcriptional regulator [Arcanobacterium wilhelmae]